MPQSLSAVYIHLVFSTKERLPLLRETSIRQALHAYMGSVSKQMDCLPVTVGGVEDHVHILARLSRSVPQAEWVKELKRVSSLWLKREQPSLRDFQWQGGYAAYSVSQSKVGSVTEYIANQEKHHKSMSYQDEVRRILKKHGMEYDERYLWD